MKKLLLAGIFLASFGATSAYADDCIDVGGATYCDPTAFHVSGNLASGSDPVLINQGTEFKIIDNSGADIDPPLTVFFAAPLSAAVPVVSATDFNGGPPTGPVTVNTIGTWTFANGPNDLYSFIGCVNCNNSINISNIQSVFALENLTVPTALAVYSVVVPQGFTNKDDYEEFLGSFATGTIIAPLSTNVVTKNGHTTVTYYDTSWTNAGFIDSNPVINPTGGAPEPSTWAMGLLGFAAIGAFAWRRNRMSVA